MRAAFFTNVINFGNSDTVRHRRQCQKISKQHPL